MSGDVRNQSSTKARRCDAPCQTHLLLVERVKGPEHAQKLVEYVFLDKQLGQYALVGEVAVV